MKSKNSSHGTAFIILAAIFWGSMGIFVRSLSAYGLSSIQIASVRLTVSALLMALILLYKEPSGFRISRRDVPLFLALGLISVLFFTVCYFAAIELMTLSAAAILLYTSPIWVMLMSLIVFKEKFSTKKLAALILAFLGCVLVSGIGSGGITPLGVLVGLGAGIGYGLYSILSSIALRRYSPLTVTAYTFIIAAGGSWFICTPADMISHFAAAGSIWTLTLLVFATGLITAVVPFMCYNLGLKTVEASRAAIFATIEPVVASALGVIVFHETLTVSALLGIILVLSGVILLSVNVKK